MSFTSLDPMGKANLMMDVLVGLILVIKIMMRNFIGMKMERFIH